MTRSVLIVDDNEDLAENLAEILVDEGFRTEVHFDPRKALAALVPGRHAVALLDIRMPGMDGVELYRALKLRDPTLPAIAMTAWARDDRVRAALDEGVIAVLPKPLEVTRLLAKLASIVHGEAALVVEDDPAYAQNLVELLCERGFAARAAHTCDEARKLAGALAPTVILAYWRLPDGDGIDLVEELCARVPRTAILFSGHARELADPRGRAEACGARFFEKPLDLARLFAALDPRRAEG